MFSNVLKIALGVFHLHSVICFQSVLETIKLTLQDNHISRHQKYITKRNALFKTSSSHLASGRLPK